MKSQIVEIISISKNAYNEKFCGFFLCYNKRDEKEIFTVAQLMSRSE
jgi:hypothetical protein